MRKEYEMTEDGAKLGEALAKAREADAVGGKTGAEQLIIDRMKAAAAQRAGDFPTAIAALEAIHPKATGAEQGQLAEQLAAAYAQTRNNGKATEWMNKAIASGNTSPTIRQLQQYLLGASGDYNAIARDAGAAVAAAEQAGRRPAEGDLLRLAQAGKYSLASLQVLGGGALGVLGWGADMK